MTERKKILVLIAAAGVAAVLVNFFRANGLSWLADPETPASQENMLGTSMELDELLRCLNRGSAVLVDARNAEEFACGRLAGAVNLPAGRKIEHLGRIFEMLPPDEVIIIYGEENYPKDSWDLAGFLIENGFKPENLSVFEPGWEKLKLHQDIPLAKGQP